MWCRCLSLSYYVLKKKKKNNNNDEKTQTNFVLKNTIGIYCLCVCVCVYIYNKTGLKILERILNTVMIRELKPPANV